MLGNSRDSIYRSLARRPSERLADGEKSWCEPKPLSTKCQPWEHGNLKTSISEEDLVVSSFNISRSQFVRLPFHKSSLGREKKNKAKSVLAWIYWSGCCNIKIKFNQKNIILQSATFMKTLLSLHLGKHSSRSRGSLSTVDIHSALSLAPSRNLHQKSNLMQMIYTSAISRSFLSSIPFFTFCNYLN